MMSAMGWFGGLWPSAVVACLLALASSALAVPPPNDDCATPDNITGTGFFVFDNCEANTGTEGQNNVGCSAGDDNTIYFDLWYCWTAPFSGVATVSTCTLTTADTKIAVYGGCGCPATDFGPIACDDNGCDLQSTVSFDVVCGREYLIQIGSGTDLCWQGEFLIEG